jgi:hypothetical protein
MKRTFPMLSILLISSFLLGACGSSADNASTIATSVALTVQAQATSAPKLPSPSATPANLTTVTALTPAATPTTAIASGSYANCMVASLVSENPPDGVIYKPGQTFLKTWHIQNNSTCAWTTGYKIIFWNGDQMGSAYNYNFPQGLPAGESADISIQLKAPDTAGTFKGEWKLQTPDGQNFGVGQYSTPFWTEIVVVAANETPTYGVTSVTYDLVRTPPIGCNTNTWYTVTAHISFSGPLKEVIFQFLHSDGFKSQKFKGEITGAVTIDFTDPNNGWKFYIADTQGAKWIRLIQISPEYVEYDKVNFTFECK